MPNNTTAIAPRKEVTGQPTLPLARVKKIVNQDPDITICSSNAAFVITVATEMFIQHLASEAHNMTKLDRKPRKNVQYKDLANAVAHNDNLEFLEDVIPKTIPFKKVKAQAAAARARVQGENPEGAAGTLAAATTNGSSAKKHRPSSGVNGVNGSASMSAPEDDPNAQLETEMRQAADEDRDGDVSMTG